MRTILHCDINNFYASVECLYNPDLRGKPLAVTGDADERHGIVLAKNYPAKAYGIKTGDVIWEAKNKCPHLITIPADFKKYLRFSDMITQIYARYTDLIEPFGIDEAWLDITSVKDSSGKKIADEIRNTILRETGVTASVGVSFNKIFAKLGSDLKKPDATTIIDFGNYKQKIWGLPVSELLYAGRVTAQKLYRRCIYTIGDLANTDVNLVKAWLGKCGQALHDFANGRDYSPVKKWGEGREIKSVGNSMTCYRDLTSNSEVKALIYVLAESVASRMKKQGLIAGKVAVHIKDSDLKSYTRQCAVPPTQLSEDIAESAMELFVNNYGWHKNVRALGVKAGNFEDGARQLSIFDGFDYVKINKLETAVEDLRERFGHNIIQRGRVFCDKRLILLNPEKDNVIHPIGYDIK
jgi:DNA polymerase-4